MDEIKLIATDLDGTLIGPKDEHASYDTFRDTIEALKSKHGTVWSISTGRSIRSFRQVFQPMILAGIRPDYVIVKHAYIYGSSGLGYTPHFWWNLQTRYMILKNQLESRKALRACHRMILARFRHVRTTRSDADRICIRFRDPEAAGAAAALIRNSPDTPEHLQIFEYMFDIELRLIPFTKGLAVDELARQLNIPSANILTVGDGHNDMSMLVEEIAGMTGCPANAKAEVVDLVHSNRGHISAMTALSGTIDVIKSHLSGSVSSGLPDNWDEVSGTKPGAPRRSRTRSESSGLDLKDLAILFAVAGSLLVALARFGLLGPHLSRWIMLPFNKAISLLVKLAGLL